MTHNHTLKRIAVVGGGLSGVSTAFFLALAGFEVTLLERRANVAEEATFGNSGLLAPSALHPLALPGTLRTACSTLFDGAPPILVKSGIDLARWRWRRASRRAHRTQAALNKQRLTRLAAYGQMLTLQLQEQYALAQENSLGLLHLFGLQADADRRAAISDQLRQFALGCQAVTGDDIRRIDPALQPTTPLAGALYYPQDGAGNCVLFVKQLRTLARSLGVQFRFSQPVIALRPDISGRVDLTVGGDTLTVDGVVLAAGIQNLRLLKPLGLSLPLLPVQSYGAVATVRNHDLAPTTAIFDETYQVAITRLGNRIRVCGLHGFLPPTDTPHPKAIRSLLKVANMYYPDAANFNTANFWSSTFARQPNGLPLVGLTSCPHVYINTSHGAHGWSTAVASAKLLADVMAGRATDIDSSDLLLPARTA